jgi:hypothetical protein
MESLSVNEFKKLQPLICSLPDAAEAGKKIPAGQIDLSARKP